MLSRCALYASCAARPPEFVHKVLHMLGHRVQLTDLKTPGWSKQFGRVMGQHSKKHESYLVLMDDGREVVEFVCSELSTRCELSACRSLFHLTHHQTQAYVKRANLMMVVAPGEEPAGLETSDLVFMYLRMAVLMNAC